ncbi:DMT family transporter [Desulfofundulus thermocisternus]|uniref:DMT family transporter n=1 Tax=Desulfofundulus thermocisternus TaxID=42471 RepID=UPI0009FC12F0|nr:DMT family transporter [Desulfofundulus thermocisternus]
MSSPARAPLLLRQSKELITANLERPFVNPYLAILVGVMGAAFSSIFTKLAAAPPMVIAFYRLGFTVLMIAPVVLTREREELRSMGRRDILLACLSGVLLALHFTAWIASLEYTSIASSTVLVAMQPLFTVLGGYLLYREKIALPGLAGAALALLGSVMVGVGDFQIGGRAFWGDILAFAGAIFVAGYVLIGRGLRHRLSLLPYIFVVYGASAVTLLAGALLAGVPLFPYPPTTWLWFFLLALVSTIFGHTIFNWALRYVKAAVVSVSLLGEPVGATILAYFIFHQVPSFLQLAGGLAIIAGLAIFIRAAGRQE